MIYILPLLSVLLGYLVAIFIKPSTSIAFKLLLSFSGAYLLSVTVFNLLPEVYQSGENNIGIFIMLGLLVQILLEFLSKGVEHGHFHFDASTSQFPLVLLISLCIHSFLEGFPLNSSDHLLHGVVIHKIPVAAILSAFLIHSRISRAKVFLFLIIFALMTPLGSYTQSHFEPLARYSLYINAMVIGIFLHVSTTILFESSKNHKFNASKLGAIVFAILLAYFL